MRVYLASDHAGLALKEIIEQYLSSLGHEAIDLGPLECSPEDDYPLLIKPCAEAVVREGCMGVVFGGSGQGEAMVANRVSGARTAVFYGPEHLLEVVALARAHNDANILSLGARFISEEDAKEAVRLFLETPFSNEERHVRRIAQF